ncbi:MAG: DNA-binding protein [Candidatus Bathyarchaeia archaeon]|nr:DNA-binding protein [Candidatus Bathyarchaeota archaeon]
MAEGKIGRIIFSKIKTGEDLIEAIKEKAEKCGVKAGLLIVIGTLENATLGYYKGGEYKYIRIDEPLEIASCMGNIAVEENGETAIHVHIVVTTNEGKAFGGHLMNGSRVGATAELVIIEALDVNLKRAFDETTKLKLLNLE